MPATRSTRRNQETKTASTATDGAPETAISERKRGLSVTGASVAKRPKKSSSSSITNQPKSAPKRDKTAQDKDTSEADKSTEKSLETRETERARKIKPEEGKDEEEEVGKPSSSQYTSAGKRKTKEEQSAEMNPLAPRASGLRMYVGAHVSAAKADHTSRGNAFALFLKSQRKWDNPPLQDEHRDLFKKACVENNYDAALHVLPHGSYLVNLAQEDPAKAKVAYNSFLDDLKRCEALGIKLYNFHPGATNKTSLESSLSRLAKALISALDATKTVIPVLETMCGHGTTIGGPLSHFRDLFALIPESYHPRLGVCVDTCHSFAAGYDLRSPAGWDRFMTEFDETIGLKFLRAWHLNDSKTPLGSNRDLHANIGTGFLGLRAFHNLMNDKRAEGMPMVLETPIDRPVEGAGTGAKSKKTIEDKSVWAKEIKLLESLIGMDPESKEFLELEAKLADEGKEERAKHQAMFDKKAKENSGKSKDIRSMFGKGKPKRKGSKKDDSSEDATDGECGSSHE
ncbi:DNA (apurinic or apyrimidinic site) lyase, endon uclease [Trichophyton benhamiae CBS 112371]|uniref:Apurinic-apyrimidinic endonuclease 1 n=1 Tax=Arthroderma benhamiae (strain ATCC MYA-4681 / CBS 112371) TaxID=663331 RepID=D4AUI9_ARTBC|nr:DNA (apurinic or apyrimidinic site) lyase, endon uclease [Trichophyton benhamiae CBS 112371]EFE33154.1 DNA (apurinic or apyrimidinic site) lyase, endon uclease [Trichophyton benhamiae CBS 112371]